MPEFPEMNEEPVLCGDSAVQVSLDWFLNIADFKIDYEACCEYYNRLKTEAAK